MTETRIHHSSPAAPTSAREGEGPAVGRGGRRGWQRDFPTRVIVSAVVVIVGLLAVIAAFGALSGGYIFTRAAPVAVVAAGLAIIAVWLVRGPRRPSRVHAVGLIAFAAFVAWSGLSVLWSVGPDLSWVSFDFAALYLLVAVVCGFLPGGPAQLRTAAYGFALVTTLLAGYALLGKLAPPASIGPLGIIRLRGSIGYWNVLAAFIAMAVPIGLEAASRPRAPVWLRGLVSSVLVGLLVTFFFTFSRGGFIALGVALIVWFARTRRRLSGFASLAVPALVVIAVLWHVRHLTTLFDATSDDALRTAQAHALARWVLVAALAAFAAQVVVAVAQRRRPLPARAARRVGTALLVVLVTATVGGGAFYVARHGGTGWVRTQAKAALSGAGPSGSASRLASLGSSGRGPWYREALRGFVAHPLAGSGAGTFRFTNYLYRRQPGVVNHSHSEWLNVMSELGLVGLVLFMTAVVGLVAAAFDRGGTGRGGAGRSDPERALLAACQAGALAFVVHMSIDWDWDMPVITLAFLLLAGVAAAYVATLGSAPAPRSAADADEVAAASAGARAPGHGTWAGRELGLGIRLLVTGLVCLGVVSWALPYLSERADLRAVDQASRGRLVAAAGSARQSADLDPLAVDPLVTLAFVQADRGRPLDARATLLRAVRLQPRNYRPYYELGMIELSGLGDRAQAAAWFRRALTLDPLDPLTRQQLGLP